MTRIEVRYWAAAREAAGCASEVVAVEAPGPTTLADVVTALLPRHDARFARVLAASSLLVDGVAVGHLDPTEVALAESATVEVLPPFAGG